MENGDRRTEGGGLKSQEVLHELHRLHRLHRLQELHPPSFRFGATSRCEWVMRQAMESYLADLMFRTVARELVWMRTGCPRSGR